MKAHWFLESWRGTQKLRAFPLQSLLANDKPLVKDLEARALLLPVEAAPSSLCCSTKGTKVAPKSLSDLLPLIRLLKSFYEELLCFCHRFVHVIKAVDRFFVLSESLFADLLGFASPGWPVWSLEELY
ncbi:hypothetical protein NC652_034909 [Populus alba x Populus x berolinensis]|nr:hypothetical protein NC652_034909 [Populus alba x Populus x berolinensis]